MRTPLTIPTLVARATGVLALLALAVACGPSGDRPTAVTTSAPAGSSSTTTTAPPGTTTTTRPPDPTTAPPSSPPTGDPAGLQFSIYWTRAMGDPTVIDIAGYRDPATGPHPYVLFGSVSNPGDAAVDQPAVRATWRREGIEPVSVTGRVIGPDGADLDSIPAGGSADVLVVVSDQSLAGVVADSEPELTGVVR